MVIIRSAESQKYLRVKFMAKEHGPGQLGVFARQLPRPSMSWGRCQFLFDPDEPDYDWLVCYDDLAPAVGERFSQRIERLACPRQRTLLVTVEPSSIKVYGREFLEQFGVVLTSQEPWAIGVDNAHFSQPALRWYYGAGGGRLIDLEQLRAAPAPLKTRQLSTVCSNKRQTSTLHARRFQYTHELAARLPQLEVFGRGIRTIGDKAEGLDPFCYHLAIENHVARHHWTEKLSDAYLGRCLPLYVGCPNLSDYFPEESFVMLDLEDVEGSVAKIHATIERNLYERSLTAIEEARRRVIERYSLFAVIAEMVEARHEASAGEVGELLYSRHALRRQGVVHAFRFAVERYRTRGRSRRLMREVARGGETIVCREDGSEEGS